MQKGSMEALKKGVCVFKKDVMSVYLFADHHRSVIVQLVRITESAFPVASTEQNPQGSMVMLKTPMILNTVSVPVHEAKKSEDIKPEVQKAVEKMKSEAEKVLQSDERVAGVLGDYKSQSGSLNE